MTYQEIGGEHEAAVKQALYNLVATGHRLIAPDGTDMSEAIRHEGEQRGFHDAYCVQLEDFFDGKEQHAAFHRRQAASAGEGAA